MDPIDTSKYLDAIQKAQAQSVAGVEQIGTAYKGYQDNLKKQNTNDMLTALNQAKNPEELAIAQANIAAMQQRWGSGYDMDAVRTAMDERPATLMQRQSTEMDFKDKKANIAARPQVAAIYGKQLAALDATPEELAQIQAIADTGVDITDISTKVGQYLTNARDFTNKNYWELQKLNQDADQYNRTATLAEQESALRRGEVLYKADQDSGAGSVRVAPDGTEYTTGGGGGAAIARYASVFGPLAAGMIHTESKGNPNAVSPAGAQGIIQIMPATAADPGYGMPPIDLKNSTPEEQIRWGMEYRSRVQKQHGFTEDQATAAFNAGGGNVEQAVKKAKKSGGNWLSYLPKETRDYVPRVNKAMAEYSNGGSGVAGNTPANVPLAGIDRKVQQKIRGEYQDAMLKYNEGLALKDQPVNVGNVLAGLTAKEEGSKVTQDAFDIAKAMQANPQLAGLSAEGITNVYNRAKAWQSQPGGFFEVYNSAAGLKKSIDNLIKGEISIDAKRKKHVAKASHPSNTYVQKIQQEFEAEGVSISAKEALLHIDPARYQSLYGKPTVKVQEALDKKVDKAAATTPPPASKGKGTPAATKTTPTKTSVPTSTTPVQAKNPTPTPTKQAIVDFYVKRGKVDNVIPGNLFGTPDSKVRDKNRDLIRQAQKEATERLKAIEAKEKADKEAKKASQLAAREKIRIAAAEREKQRIAKERLKLANERIEKAKQKSDQQKKFEATYTNAIKAGNEEMRKRFNTK
jgi:soluble lytic murein transglycosylase-like protein